MTSGGNVTINNASGVTLSQATTMGSTDTLNLENGAFTNGTNLSMSSGSTVIRDNGTLGATPTTYSGVNLIYANLGNNAAAVTAGNEFPASFTGNVTVNKSGATITLNNAKTLTGNLTLTAGTLDASASNYNISLTGNWTNNSGTTAFTARSGTVSFNGSAAQTLSGTSATSFFNLTNSNTTAALSVNASENVSGTLNMNGAATLLTPAATAIFNSGGAAGVISGTGSIQVTRIAAVADYADQYKFSTNTLTAMTVDYAGAGAQTINSTVGNYGYLKTSNSGTKTLQGIVTVNNNVTIGSSTTLDVSAAGNYTLNVGGNWTNNGTFTAENGTVYMTGTAVGLTLNGTMTGTSQFYNLVFLGGAGAAWSFTSVDAEVGNSFNISTGTVTAPADTLTIHGNWFISAAFTNNNGTVLFSYPSSGILIGGSVAMTGANKFNNLAFTGGGGWTFNTITSAQVAGNFTIGTGCTVVAPSVSLLVAKTWSNSGTYTANGGTVTLNGATVQNLTGSSNTTFNNLILNNSTGAGMTADETVNNTLTLTSGNFNVGANNLTLGLLQRLSRLALLRNKNDRCRRWRPGKKISDLCGYSYLYIPGG